ncbi:MAG: hypothetical protein N2445_08065, partial [Acidobacteria bacterium]|nr:hypothetical protein [Acidobacteriota bacterium]
MKKINDAEIEKFKKNPSFSKGYISSNAIINPEMTTMNYQGYEISTKQNSQGIFKFPDEFGKAELYLTGKNPTQELGSAILSSNEGTVQINFKQLNGNPKFSVNSNDYLTQKGNPLPKLLVDISGKKLDVDEKTISISESIQSNPKIKDIDIKEYNEIIEVYKEDIPKAIEIYQINSIMGRKIPLKEISNIVDKINLVRARINSKTSSGMSVNQDLLKAIRSIETGGDKNRKNIYQILSPATDQVLTNTLGEEYEKMPAKEKKNLLTVTQNYYLTDPTINEGFAESYILYLYDKNKYIDDENKRFETIITSYRVGETAIKQGKFN